MNDIVHLKSLKLIVSLLMIDMSTLDQKIAVLLNVRNIVEPLYCEQHWDKYKCPDYRGVLIPEVNLYHKAQFGTFVSVLNTGVFLFQGVLNREVLVYRIHVCHDLRKMLVWKDQIFLFTLFSYKLFLQFFFVCTSNFNSLLS